MKNLPNLYPLRFLLCIVVIIYHIPLICRTLNIPYYNAAPIFQKGMLAVYYFFSLSGFLILRLVYNELRSTNDFNFKNFFLRRIQRLYPVYYLVVFVGIILYFFILPQIGVASKANYSLSELILYYVFFIPNVFRYKYPSTGSILIILWSIGIEEQFYLFMPGFMYVFRKKLMLSLAALLTILVLLLLFVPSFYKSTNYYFYFAFGGLLSITTLRKRIAAFQNKLLHIAIYILTILSFATNLFNFQNLFLFHFTNMIISGLLISLVSDYPVLIISNKVIDHLGKISYGIYAYHMIIITGVVYLANRFQLFNHMDHTVFIIMLNIIIIVLAAAIANLSYKYFENRFYKSKH